MFAIYKRELRSYFKGAIGFVFLTVYLVVAAIVFAYSNLFAMSSHMTSFFTFMLLFSGIALPLLTMKSFSEERKTKTEQLLLTSPISITGMVIGKFLASYVIFGGALVLTSLYFLVLYPYAELKVAVLFGSMIALLLVGMVFISVGLFVSALTENQLSAAVGSIGIILALLGVSLLSSLIPSSYFIRFVIDSLSVFTRFQGFSNGYFDVASIFYYLSVSAIFIYLTVRVYDRRRYS